MDHWVSVCRVADLISGRGRKFVVAGMKVALVRMSEQIVALEDRCPHAGGSLGQGSPSQGWVEDDELFCPLHRWRFELAGGRCTTVPGQDLRWFPAEVRGDCVWVQI